MAHIYCMINKDLIKKVLLEDLPKKEMYPRDIKFVNVNKIYSVIGPRRAGKTYFLFEIINALLNKKVDRNRILYLNFEDERLDKIETEDLQIILDTYYELYPQNKKEKLYLFFDEIQNAPNWQKFVRRIYDKENCELYITGSSAKLLSKEIATELRGRTWDYYVYPFSFKEFLQTKNITLDNTTVYSSKRYEIVKYFDEYLTTGGFPEVVTQDSFTRCKILQNYLDVVILRDVVERYKINAVDLVKEMILFLANNFSRPFSVNAYYKFLKSQNKNIGKDTLYTLQSHIENTLYFYFIPIFSASAKVKSSNPKKIYIVDSGLANCLSIKANKDEGWVYENIAFLELMRRGYNLFYFKDKYECDFVATDVSGNKTLFQVTIDASEPRELNGLLEAMKQLKTRQGYILNKDIDKTEIIDGFKVIYIPLWKWLLQK